VLSVQISCLVRSSALWISAQGKMNVRYGLIINKAKQLVDVAPHWGEPCISCVFGVIFVVLFML
jgi:hypothetical protein